MRQKSTRVLSLILAILLVLTIPALAAFAAEPSTGVFSVTSGIIGSHADAPQWTLDGDGVVTVTGGIISDGVIVYWNGAFHWIPPAHRAAVTEIRFTASVIAGNDMSHFFRYLLNLVTITGADYIDTSNVTRMDNMFAHARNLTGLDVSNWNTSNVTNMGDMFTNTPSLTELDVSNWNTSNVTDMNAMFINTPSLTELDVSNWDTSNVTNMMSMFFGATSLTELDVSNWNTSNVTDMMGMFANTISLTELDLSNWNTSSVLAAGFMGYIFWGTYNLRRIVFGSEFVPFANTPNSLEDVPEGGVWINLDELNPSMTSPALWEHLLAGGRTVNETWVWAEEYDITLQHHIVRYFANDGSSDVQLIHQIGTDSVAYHSVNPLDMLDIYRDREGYLFTGWNTAPDGSATAHAVADIVAFNTLLDLHAQWEPDPDFVTPTPPPTPMPPTPPLDYELHLLYMIGDEHGTFRPTANITRAEVATILARTQLLEFAQDVQTLPPGMGSFDAFADVNPGDWHYFYIAWAYDAGLVQGFGGYFRPNDPITREEVAATMARMGTILPAGDLSSFGDANAISDWARDYVYTALSGGLMIGDEGLFRPNAHITRAEVATATNRTLGRVDSMEVLGTINVASLPDARRFPDVSESAWYFPSVLGAANDHRLTRGANGYINWIEFVRN